MHTLEPELRALVDEGTLDPAVAERLIARDRGDALSIHTELRLLLYAGVLLVTGGVATVLARNLDRIGPLAIVLAVAAAAVACSIPAVRARLAGGPLSAAADYLLLLTALLVSADVGYAEHAFQLFGPLWSWHLLLLAVVHAVVAYLFGSALVLGVSLAALAGWFGVGFALDDAQFLFVGHSAPELGARALTCAAVILGWRWADFAQRADTRFTDTFDHFLANVAFAGAVAWCHGAPWMLFGLPLLAAFTTASMRYGLRQGREAFVVYGVLYAALGLGFALLPRVHDTTGAASIALLIVSAAAFTLWHLHQRLREATA